jgi:hypothetical protein
VQLCLVAVARGRFLMGSAVLVTGAECGLLVGRCGLSVGNPGLGVLGGGRPVGPASPPERLIGTFPGELE